MNLQATRKLYASLAISDSELDKIERIAREIDRLQKCLHEAILDEVSSIEQEEPFLTRSERKRLAAALVADLDITGADLSID